MFRFPKFRDNAAAKRVSRNLITLNHQAADSSFFSILALRRLVDDSMGPSKGLTFEGNNNFIGPRIIVVAVSSSLISFAVRWFVYRYTCQINRNLLESVMCAICGVPSPHQQHIIRPSWLLWMVRYEAIRT